MDFQEVDRQYAELKRQYDSGELSGEALDEQRAQLMVQDAQGRWWTKEWDSGEWNYHDGHSWVRAYPPVAAQPVQPTEPAYQQAIPPPTYYPATYGSYGTQDYARPQPGSEYDGQAIAAFVLGIVSLGVTLSTAVCGIPIGVVGIIFGVIGQKAAMRSFAVGGLVTSIISLVLGFIFVLFIVIIFAVALNTPSSYYP